MDFSSDTSAPAHPRVLEAIAEANSGMMSSYGGDELTRRLKDKLCSVFETDLLVLPVASGTASNALALSLICRSDEAIICHREAHIERDERGAPEFFTGGGKLMLVDGAHGKMDPETVLNICRSINRNFVHETPAAAISLSNLTECGTAYSTDEVAALTRISADAALWVHMDGARLANALNSTGATPAGMTWKAGIDILSLGLTKTGALGCELICLFGRARDKYPELLARAKRGGHLPPKMRYLSAQALAMLDGDLWLQLADKANQNALELAGILTGQLKAEIRHPVGGNEVFATFPEPIQKHLFDAGLTAYPWTDGSIRFVCHWGSEPDIASLKATITSV